MTLAVLLFIAFGFGDPGREGSPADKILKVYQKADALFHLDNSTPATDSEAIAGFDKVIKGVEKQPAFPGRDTLLALSFLKRGILLDVRTDFATARDSYRHALQYFGPKDDSLVFVTSVLTGACFYNLNVFDSANYFLLRAQAMADRFQNSEDGVRLYNTLGVLYYDNGDYLQSRNFFGRALDIIQGRRPFDTAFAVNIQTNMATSSLRLGQYREALAIYNKILSYDKFTDLIYMNMGMAYASLQQYQEATKYFRKVDEKQIPAMLNEMADAQRQLHRPDSSAWYLDRLRVLAQKRKINEQDLGINDMLRSDLLSDGGSYLPALQALQQSIIVFARNFDKKDIYTNPADFTGSFACYRLFDALFKKAVLFERLYHAQPREQYLQASYDAYNTALALARYIEKSYDTDDAKIFLKKKNAGLYHGVLSVCLQLNTLHPQGDYLRQAFLIGEKSKASIITANLKERGLRHPSPYTSDLIQQESNLKYNIARLNVKTESAADEAELNAIAKEKAGYQIQLSVVQKKLEKNGTFYRLKYDDSSPGISDLQQGLDRDQALISFAATTDALHAFALTRNGFAYTRIDSLTGLGKDVETWLKMLENAGNGRRFHGEAVASDLYRRLVKPLQTIVPDKKEWIIVPEGFLYYLPFESLPASEDPDGKTLLETTTISYQFSARLLLKKISTPLSRHDSLKVLSFAPFTGHGGSFGANPSDSFSRLPASAGEIAGLPGPQYLDSRATKDNFLQEINKYPIVHLATHAVSSIDNAAASYIAFYPFKGKSLEDRLYLEELYGLNMDATRLVVISACETGQGELVNNEGVISLARAFAYAGCESSVNSLWKADDQATSFILRKFHAYLDKGYTKASALRQAKLDYIHSDAFDKSPAYWAHLILIGNNDPLYTNGNRYCLWGTVVVLALSAGFTTLLIFRRKRLKTKKARPI